MAGVVTIDSGLELFPLPAAAVLLLPRFFFLEPEVSLTEPACHNRIVIFLSGTGHRIDLIRVVIGSTFIFIAQSTSQRRVDRLNTTKPAVGAVEQKKDQADLKGEKAPGCRPLGRIHSTPPGNGSNDPSSVARPQRSRSDQRRTNLAADQS